MISAGFWRRLGAWVYDALVVLTIFLMATLVAVAANGGHAIAPQQIWFEVWLLGCLFAYFWLSWRAGGQTLGMRPWRIKLRSSDGKPLRFWQMLVRYLVAWISFLVVGLGFFWALIPPQRATWHDLASRTRVTDRSAV